MGFFDWLADCINDISVSRENNKRQGLVRYKPCALGCFVETDAYERNTLVSGGNEQLRAEAIGSMCIAACNAHVPVVILHIGDEELIKELDRIFGTDPRLQKIDEAHPYFDPFDGIDESRISKLIQNSSNMKFPINATAATYIDGMLDYMASRGKLISARSMSKCPHDKLPQLLQQAGTNNTLTQAKVHDILSKITQGSAERATVKSYFKELYDQCEVLMPSSTRSRRLSIPWAISNQCLLVMDVIEADNDLLIRLVLQQMKDLAKKGIRFMVVLDNITICPENGLDSFSTMNSTRIRRVFSGTDLFSMCAGKKDTFNAILGLCPKWFVFRHKAGASAKHWEAGFGQYMKIDTSYNYGTNTNRGTNWWLLGFGGSGSSGRTSGKTYTNRDEAVFRADALQKLGERAGLVYTEDPLELAYVDKFLAP